MSQKVRIPLLRSNKPALALFVMVLVILSTFAAEIRSPQTAVAATNNNINFQARLMSNTGGIVPDGFYNVEFKIYKTLTSSGSSQGSCTGDANCLWTETYYDTNGVTAGNDFRVRVANGYLTVSLGSRTAFPSTINWDQQMWITMNIGGTTQTASPTYDGEMSPRLQLTGVPYAFRAGQLASLAGSFTGVLQFAASFAQDSTITLPDPGASTATVCYWNSTSCGFATGTAGSYIQNGTSVQSPGNFAIRSAAAGSVGGVIQGFNGQSVDLFDVQTWNGTTATTVVGVSNVGLLTLSAGATATGTIQVNATGSGATTIGNSSGGVLTVASGAASSIAVTGNTLSLSATNFSLNNSGILSLIGGQTQDITTPAGTTATGLTVRAGASNGASSNGGSLTLGGGDASGTTNVTGGSVSIQGGNATGGSGTRNGGSVTIDGGTSAASAANNGAVNLGTTNASAIGIGHGNITTTVTGSAAFNIASASGITVTSDLSTGARSTPGLLITQANDATNSNSSNLLKLQNSDSSSTAAALQISNVSAGKSLNLTGTTTGTAIDISGSNLTTGTGFNTDGGTLTSGSLIALGGTNAAITNAFTGSLLLGNVARTLTSGSFNDTGNFINMSRANTVNNAGSTFTVSGALVNLQSSCTQTAGTCTDTSNILNLNQQYASASGTVLNVQGAGTGNLATLDATNVAANGISIDVQASGSTKYALSVTSNNGATTGLYVRADGNVGIGNNTPSATLEVTGTVKISTLGAVSANSAAVCRDTTTNQLTACDGTNTTGRAFLQGGNSFGATAVLGTSDANNLQIITGSSGPNVRATFDTSNNLYLGNGVTAATPNAFAVQGTGSVTAGTAGALLTIKGGAGASATTGSAGGGLTLAGGSAAGSGNNAGGTITLQGGDKTNTGAAGTVLVKNLADSASAFSVQNAAGTATTLDVDSAQGFVGVGTAAPTRQLDVAVNNSTTTALPLLVEQAGSGDTGVEFKNTNRSYFVGVDSSDFNKFKISSSLASSTTVNVGYPGDTGATLDNGNNALISATQVTTSGSGGTVNSVSVYFGPAATQNVKMGLFADDGSNHPTGSPIATTNEFAATPSAWNTLPLSTAVSASTKYWIGFRVQSAATNYGLTSGSGATCYMTLNYANPWGSWVSNGTCPTTQYYSVVLNYSVTGAYDSFNASLMSLSDTGQTLFKNSSDSSTAFQVQNASSVTMLGLDTVSSILNLGVTGTTATASSVNIATSNGATQTVKVGGTAANTAANGTTVLIQGGNGASAVDIEALASGTISVGTAAASTVTVGSATATTNITLGQTTGASTVNIASGSPISTNTQTINIGNGSQSTGSTIAVNILSGAAGSNGTATLKLANNDRVTQVDIGNVVSDANRTLNVFSGNTLTGTTDTINIGTGNTAGTGAKVIHIGDGTPVGTNTVTVGSIAATGNITTIQGGNTATGNGAISIQAASTGVITIGTANNNPITLGGTSGTTTLQGTVKVSTVGAVTSNSATLCRDTSTFNLTSCDGTNTTGRPFLQGGNSFGATGVLGTTDANSLQIITGSGGPNVRATFDTSNNLYLGLGITAATPTNFTVAATGSATAGVQGANLTLQAGAGSSATTGSIGGSLLLAGGNAAGSGNNAGGTVTLQGGSKTNTGAAGTVLVKNLADSATAFSVQNAAGTSTILDVDTTSGYVGVGTAAPSRQLHVAVTTSSVNALPVKVAQSGAGDTGIEFNEPAESYYLGIDATDHKFKLSSDLAGATIVNMGYVTIGGSTDSSNSNTYEATKFTAGASGTISTVYGYVGAIVGSAPNNKGQAAIYSDSSGSPGTRLGYSTGDTTLTANAWNAFPITGTSVTNGTVYWLVYDTNGTAANQNDLKFDAGTANQTRWSTITSTYGTWQSTWPGNSGASATQFSLYAPILTSANADNFLTSLLQIGATGQTLFQNSTDSSTAFQIQNAAGTSLIGVDTASSILNLGINGTTATASTVNIATSTGATQTVAIGGASANSAANGTNVLVQGGNGASAVSIQALASGTISIGTSASNVITVGNTTSTGQLTLGQSTATNTISIGSAIPTGTNTQTINIGNGAQNTATNSTIVVNVLSSATNGTGGTAQLNLANNDRVTQVDIGNVAADANRTLNLFTGNTITGTTDTINLGTGNTVGTGAKIIHIGDGTPAGTNTVTVGSIASTANITTVQGGTGTGAVSIQAASTGTINIATANNNQLTLGGASSVIKLGSLGSSTATAVAVCRDSSTSNLITCASGGTGAPFLQGGNSFGTTGVLGTSDAQNLQIITGSSGPNVRATFDTSNNLYLGNGLTASAPNNFVISGTGSATAGTAGATLTVQAGAGSGATTGSVGGDLKLQGGNAAGSGNNAGGNVILIPGTATNTGTKGTVQIGLTAGTAGLVNNGTTVNTVATQSTASGTAITNQDLYSAFVITVTNTGQTMTLANPSPNIAGRTIYISNASSGSNLFTLAPATGTSISLNTGATATLMWNGSAWTYAGADASSILNQTAATQAAGFNIQPSTNVTAATVTGAASSSATTFLVKEGTSQTGNMMQILDNSTNAYSLFTVSSTGAMTTMVNTDSATGFQVQNASGATQLSLDTTNTSSALNLAATNGGGETSGTFATQWPAAGLGTGVTVSRDVTASEFASGVAGTKVVSTTNASSGADYVLPGGALTVSTTYIVSFSAKLAAGGTPSTFTDLDVRYNRAGTTQDALCTTGSAQTSGTSTLSTRTLVTTGWTKVTCSFVTSTTAGSAGANLAIIQTAAATTRTWYIDNLSIVAQATGGTQNTGTLRVGGASSQGLTLFTLDTYAATPFSGTNASLAGSMYFDTTQGKIQCYDGTLWGACGAAPNSNVTLTPEYAGAVLHGTGIGTLTSDFCGNGGGLSVNTSICASGEARNYYNWTSVQASSQAYSMYVTYKLPSTFKAFVNGTTTVTARTDSTSNASASYKILKSTGGTITSCSASIDVVGGTSGATVNTWTSRAPTTDPSTCSFAANNYVIIEIDVNASNSANVQVENLNFSFSNQ